jgi:nitrate/TMAO reductase-like tetraheme cytochrome c subunit
MNDSPGSLFRRCGRVLWRTGAVVLVLGLGAIVLAVGNHYLASRQEQLIVQADQDTASDWGIEALDTLRQQTEALSPVSIANACGLGASSCFRCHNGQRAPLPKTGDAGPWHDQHAKVNYSCAGCHKGNPRIIKESIAHKNLVVNPVATPAQTCGSCHTADADEKAKTYLRSHPQLTGEKQS